MDARGVGVGAYISPMELDQQYIDPRVVAIYDTENAGRDDIELYLALARELDARTVIDLACGTGVLAVDLAVAGATVIGVDPAAAMLEVARARPGGGDVRWIHGDSSAMPSGAADLVVMTGHAAQVFLDEDDWRAVLADCFRALRPGGHLAFESRNPSAGAWSRWNREDSYGTYDGPERFESWVDVVAVRPGIVEFSGHTVFAADGHDAVSASTLRFRDRSDIEGSLVSAGFTVRDVLGDWDRSPVTDDAPELIFLAAR